jgi:Ni/Fe-hydrogenase subunit HybB-like protein
MTGNRPGRRPWFGPKRIGYGLRPQTWQGWLVTVGFVAVVILIAALTR